MTDKYRILVVEDEASTRKLYTKILRSVPGLLVKEACDGAEAMEMIKKSPPDIVVCDLEMPRMDGRELCRFIKADPESDLSDIYVIIVSAREAKEDKIRCISEGADDYLTKPVDPDELIARVKVGQRITSHIKRADLEKRRMFEEIDVLLIQDGGCAPGYNPVTAFITYHLEAMGRETYATREGFKL
ncbi:MAG: response regulator [Deltaproteobacteria bacterium]|nr:response regulator [Deltaproteobacteria bacterium]